MYLQTKTEKKSRGSMKQAIRTCKLHTCLESNGSQFQGTRHQTSERRWILRSFACFRSLLENYLLVKKKKEKENIEQSP